MWKKPDSDNPQPESPIPQPRSSPAEPRREGAIIGQSISIKGELTGEEDLVIQGRFEGRVDLKQHNVTVGKNGHVKADIHGKIISVEGEVEGNLFGEEQIVIRRSGSVWGNITAARVSLEDGSKFKGSIDMDPKGDKSRAANTPAPDRPRSENRELVGNPGQTTVSSYKVDPGTHKA